jgi:hypothetical protein
MNTFKQQYTHPNWQKRRLEIMNLAGFECQNCGDTEETLNVHHKRYISGRKVWEYADDELECLCTSCHMQKHKAMDRLNALLSEETSITSIEYAIGFLEGLRFLYDQSIERIRLESWEQVDGFTCAIRGKNTLDVCELVVDGVLETAKLGPF